MTANDVKSATPKNLISFRFGIQKMNEILPKEKRVILMMERARERYRT